MAVDEESDSSEHEVIYRPEKSRRKKVYRWKDREEFSNFRSNPAPQMRDVELCTFHNCTNEMLLNES